MNETLCCLCSEQGIHRPGIAVPAIVVPIKRWPIPWYLRFRGALCRQHTCAFTIKTFTDHFGPDWYELAADALRARRAPAKNPFPDDPSFKWEEFIIDPKFDPVAKEECYVQFWEPKTLAAKGGRQKLWV